MSPPIAFEDAVDLLDTDHKAVKKLFIDFSALSEAQAPASDRRQVADKICQALTVHAQIEEEIFYPAVRKAVGEELLDEALQEHAEAKEMIAQIQAMDAADASFDDTVKELGKAIDHHVLEEREQIFLKARQSPMDLKGLAIPLAERKKELMQQAPKKPAASAKKKKEAA
ncbi:MAG: hemerythrin domain-containing protein [Pseudomonadota bacterium]